MAHPGAYRGTKRQKELKRLQKQQEKREKRLQKKTGLEPEPESQFLNGDQPPAPPEETPAPEEAGGKEPPAGE